MEVKRRSKCARPLPTSAYRAGLLGDLQTLAVVREIRFHQHHRESEPLGPRLPRALPVNAHIERAVEMCTMQTMELALQTAAAVSTDTAAPATPIRSHGGARSAARGRAWVYTSTNLTPHDGSATDYIIETAGQNNCRLSRCGCAWDLSLKRVAAQRRIMANLEACWGPQRRNYVFFYIHAL